MILKSVPPQIMKNVCLCWWVNDSPHRTPRLCITIFIQICKFLTTSVFKMYVWSLNSTTLLLKETKEKTSVNYSTKGLFWVWRGGMLFAKVTIFWRKTKTQSHMSPHIVQTMISYCSPELDRILFLNLLCCLTSNQTGLYSSCGWSLCSPVYLLATTEEKKPIKPLAPKPFQAETDLLRPECSGTHEQVYRWWMVCGQERLFHHIPVQ